jgi:fructose-bisphosphate aldolase class II
MFDRAKEGRFAYPAINVSSLESLNAALEGYAEAESDGMIQISVGGGAHASGSLKNQALGAEILAEAAHQLADEYSVLIILHTDHCHPKNLEPFLDPLIEASRRRVADGKSPLFNSHMFDGSELPLQENLEIAIKYQKALSGMNIILEVETGVVGGEEDGHDTSGVGKEKLYTTPEDMLTAYETLHPLGRFMLAATFGNVHGVYKPGNVQLEPKILRDGQAKVKEVHQTAANPLDLVFHGGSGSSKDEIRETIEYGVVKMNIDTDTQYAFTRPIVDHIMTHYDGVLKIETEVGDKKMYDPRNYLKKAIAGMKERVVGATTDLRCAGNSILK